jgi:hypothetical protein
VNEWWYGWTNTLGNRSGNSLGSEQQILSFFPSNHTIDLGVKFELRWGTIPEDLDSHLWLPASNPYHVMYRQKGSLTAFPYAALDVDDINGSGFETIWLTSPVKGTYTYAIFNYSDQDDDLKGVAGTGATVKVIEGSFPSPPRTFPVPTSGSGDWWNLLTLEGEDGSNGYVNQIQVNSPGPYEPSPDGAGGSAATASFTTQGVRKKKP